MSTLRLAVIFFLIGLTASRVGLILHEFVGHGGAAVLVGQGVADWRLSYFGGGWIAFAAGPPSRGAAVFVTVAGILVEWVLAVGLFVGSRRARPGSIAQVALTAGAAVFFIHPSFYLAAGTHHGYGDGRLLHHALGGSRALVVIPAAMAVVALGYWFARQFADRVRGWFQWSSPRRTVSVVLLAAGLAGATHAGLTLGERWLLPDATHARAMRSESSRRVDRELANKRVDLTPEQIARLRAALEAKHERFPLKPVLIVLLCVAALFGVVRSRPATTRVAAPSWNDLWALSLMCACSLFVVALLHRPFWH